MYIIYRSLSVFLFIFMLSGELIAGPFLYVPNRGSNNVSVIDLALGSEIALIPAGTTPSTVAITPDNSKAYVSNFGSGDITVIDTATNTVLTTIPVNVSANLQGIAITPDGTKGYVTDFANDLVYPFNVATNTVGAPITGFASLPNRIIIAPDGQTGYVSCTGSASLYPFSTATNTMGTPIIVGGNGGQMAITPNGQTLYVVLNQGSGTAVPVNLNTHAVGTPVSFGAVVPFGIAITPDGTTAYVTISNNTVVPFAVATGITGTPIGLPGISSTTFITITPDGTTAYVANNPTNSLSPITLSTATVGAPIPVGGTFPFTIAYTTGEEPPPPVVGPLPPTNLRGSQKNNNFGFESEFYNSIKWDPSPSANISSYKIYRNGALIGQIQASASLQFEDHHRKKGVSYTYAVTAIDASGVESSAVTVIVQP